MAKPVEILVYEFFDEAFAAAVSGTLLHGLELHDTTYQKIATDKGVRISEAVGKLLPGPGGGLKEWDVDLIVVCYARVRGKDKRARQEALQQVFDIQEEIVKLILADQTLGTRVCDLVIRKSPRGYADLDGEPFAVANMPLIINPTSGARID